MYSWQLFTLGLTEHLAWPVVVVGLVCCFKKDITKLFSRIKTLPGGAELDQEVVKEQKEEKKNFDKILAEKEIGKEITAENKEVQE